MKTKENETKLRTEVPGWTWNRAAAAAVFLARRVAGGRGPAGEKREEVTGYLWRVLAREEMARGGLSSVRGGGGVGSRRWWRSGGGMNGQLGSEASVE